MKIIEGKIINIKSNIYTIKAEDRNYEAVARGKFKIQDVTPVVGDNVEFEVGDNNQTVINNILERTTYLKRPKVSNISQIVFVISPKMPSTNLLMLDKNLAFAEFLKLNVVIVINKTDLDEKKSQELYNIYTKAGYKVIKAKANEGKGIADIKKVLKNNVNVLSRTVRSSENLQLQIKY